MLRASHSFPAGVLARRHASSFDGLSVADRTFYENLEHAVVPITAGVVHKCMRDLGDAAGGALMLVRLAAKGRHCEDTWSALVAVCDCQDQVTFRAVKGVTFVRAINAARLDVSKGGDTEVSHLQLLALSDVDLPAARRPSRADADVARTLAEWARGIEESYGDELTAVYTEGGSGWGIDPDKFGPGGVFVRTVERTSGTPSARRAQLGALARSIDGELATIERDLNARSAQRGGGAAGSPSYVPLAAVPGPQLAPTRADSLDSTLSAQARSLVRIGVPAKCVP